jgi:hypothetical protein
VNDSTPDPVAVAMNYFRCMQTGEPVAELFTADGELIGLGARVVGRDAIRAVYAGARADAAPRPEPLAVAADGNRVLAEAYIHLADGTRMHVVDGFEIAGDAIRSLTYFVADYPPPA